MSWLGGHYGSVLCSRLSRLTVNSPNIIFICAEFRLILAIVRLELRGHGRRVCISLQLSASAVIPVSFLMLLAVIVRVASGWWRCQLLLVATLSRNMTTILNW